jgi:beta-glucanase (GH16 family)
MEDPYKNFHVYAIDWDSRHIRFSIDGNIYSTFRNSGQGFEEWPFDQPFHLLLNLAVGGNWGGKYGIDEKSLPGTMLVDYVRVYQK